MPEQNPARRFRLATKVDAIARGAQIISDGLGGAGDATILEALTRLRTEVADTVLLAALIAELSVHEDPQPSDVENGVDRWSDEGGANV